MHTNNTKTIIFWSIIFSLLANILFSRWLTAKVSTLPVLNRWHLLDPQAPIVIRETREIRVGPEGEVGPVLDKLKEQVSQIGVMEKNQFSVLGNVMNFTEDGLFLTSQILASPKISGLNIRLSSGKILPIVKVYTDKNTGLAFLKVETKESNLVKLAKNEATVLGSGLLLFSHTPEGVKYFETQINFIPNASEQTFGFQNSGVETRAGMVFANYQSEVLGIWTDKLVTVEQIKKAFENYLSEAE